MIMKGENWRAIVTYKKSGGNKFWNKFCKHNTKKNHDFYDKVLIVAKIGEKSTLFWSTSTIYMCYKLDIFVKWKTFEYPNSIRSWNNPVWVDSMKDRYIGKIQRTYLSICSILGWKQSVAKISTAFLLFAKFRLIAFLSPKTRLGFDHELFPPTLWIRFLLLRRVLKYKVCCPTLSIVGSDFFASLLAWGQ